MMLKIGIRCSRMLTTSRYWRAKVKYCVDDDGLAGMATVALLHIDHCNHVYIYGRFIWLQFNSFYIQNLVLHFVVFEIVPKKNLWWWTDGLFVCLSSRPVACLVALLLMMILFVFLCALYLVSNAERQPRQSKYGIYRHAAVAADAAACSVIGRYVNNIFPSVFLPFLQVSEIK